MKKHILFLFLVFTLLFFNFVSAIPELPMIVNGEVYINDKPAKIGTDVTARVNGQEVVEFEVTEKGKFNLLLQKLNKNDKVDFYVDDIYTNQSVIYQSGDFEQLTLKVEKSFLIYYLGGVVLLLIVGFLIWKQKK